MIKPIFTIITVTYNSSRYVRDAIESILASKFTDFELIVGDDCSTDDTWAIINEFNDSRIVKYRNEVNLREYVNRNKALSMASGDWVIFIDGDDILYQHTLAAVKTYLEFGDGFGLICSRDWDFRFCFPLKINSEQVFMFEFLDKGILGGNFTKVFFKTENLKLCQFSEDIRTGDTFIQLKMATMYDTLILPVDFGWWRRSDGNATHQFFSDEINQIEVVKYKLGFLQNNCPLKYGDREVALKNIYNYYIKLIIKSLLKLRLRNALIFIKAVKVPLKYYYSILYKNNMNYFDVVENIKKLN